jgi:hypothetical protein
MGVSVATGIWAHPVVLGLSAQGFVGGKILRKLSSVKNVEIYVFHGKSLL